MTWLRNQNSPCVPAELMQMIADHTSEPDHEAVKTLVDAVIKIHADAVQAILVYGSCLRSEDYLDGLVDLYVIVNSYRDAHKKISHRIFNRLLPPNVYYLESPMGKQKVRAKYAVISLADFKKATSSAWFHSYFWGRFTQSAGLAYTRNDKTKKEIYYCLAQAVLTFCLRVVPRLPNRFDIQTLWRKGLAFSYDTELRVEKAERTAGLFDMASNYYEAITPLAIAALPYNIHRDSGGLFCAEISSRTRLGNRTGWQVRRLQGKILSVMRLLKGLATFHGGIDYIVWKLERHSGEKIEVKPRERRYPAIFIWGLFWRLYRRGIFR